MHGLEDTDPTTEALRELPNEYAVQIEELAVETAARLRVAVDALRAVDHYLVLVVTEDGALVPYAMPDGVRAMRAACDAVTGEG